MLARLTRACLLVTLLLAALAAPAGAAQPPAQHHAYLPLVAAAPADPDLAAITAAAAGLLYPSETDAPLDPFVAPAGLAPAEVCAAEAAPGESVEVADVGRALAGPATARPWMSAAELETAARFAALQGEIESRLTGAISCRIGYIRVRVLILGIAPSGLVVGLRTVSVET
jgi:hypothetical protein